MPHLRLQVVPALLVCGLLLIPISCTKPDPLPCMDAAVEAARWIHVSIENSGDLDIWPAVAGDAESVNPTLYNGVPGPVLFYLELYHSTGDLDYLEEARLGADHLLEHIESITNFGLYTGLAGVGFTLSETYKATGIETYKLGFLRCLNRIGQGAVHSEEGVEWSSVTDIIGGVAGTGLFLLYAAEELQDPVWLDLADKAGSKLTALAVETDSGLKWRMDPGYPQLMPNFSHGTAGIAYFLACLSEATGNSDYLETAQSGANYLLSIAETSEDACLIFHHEPGGEDLFYLGWCHGPVGTARLFFKLFTISSNPVWLEWAEKGANALLDSGIPEVETPGFWNNVGVCCGSAGVADFMLSLYEITHKDKYLEFAGKLTDQILTNGTRSDSGLFWEHAEHRARPEFIQAQTGLMQGAAGIGLWLLRFDNLERGRSRHIILPDDPFK